MGARCSSAECASNKRVWERVQEHVVKNQETTDGKKNSIATQMRHACVELLTTNRYMDEDKPFYDAAETYEARILFANVKTAQWAGDFGKTQNHLERNHAATMEIIDAFSEKVSEVLIRLEKQGG
jgi:hypothetical protein